MQPALKWMLCPVIHLASSLAKKAITFTIVEIVGVPVDNDLRSARGQFGSSSVCRNSMRSIFLSQAQRS